MLESTSSTQQRAQGACCEEQETARPEHLLKDRSSSFGLVGCHPRTFLSGIETHGMDNNTRAAYHLVHRRQPTET